MRFWVVPLFTGFLVSIVLSSSAFANLNVPSQCRLQSRNDYRNSDGKLESSSLVESYRFNCKGVGLFEVALPPSEKDLFLSWDQDCSKGSRNLVGDAPTEMNVYVCKREWADKLHRSSLMTIRFFDL